MNLLRLLPAAVLAAVLGLSPAAHAQSPAIIAIVNDHPITELDLTQRIALLEIMNDVPKGGLDKKAALHQLIDQEVKLQEAQRYNLLPTDTDLADRIKKHMGARVRILPPGVEKNVKDFAQNVESLVDKVVSGKRERLWFTACEPVSLCVCVEA